MRRRRGARAHFTVLAVVAGFGVVCASCAPRRLPLAEIGPEVRRLRYHQALLRRVEHGRGVLEELSLWVRGRLVRGLPGAKARVLIAGPDGFRLRVESALGTALDLSARGDTLRAYVPREQFAIDMAAAGDSLGVHEPGAIGYCLWSAAWTPPDSAWRSATWADTLLGLHWTSAEHSWELWVGSNGLPHTVVWHRQESDPVRVRYLAWSSVEGVLWPFRWMLERSSQTLSVSCRVRRVRFVDPPDRDRLWVRFPATAERLTRARLDQLLERFAAGGS